MGYTDDITLILPKECCYCNSALGTESYELKASWLEHGGRIRKTLIISVPICKTCLSEYKTKNKRLSLVGYLLLASVIGIPIILFTSLEGNCIWPIVAGIFIFGLYYLYDDRFIQPILPVRVIPGGTLLFRNNAYDKEYRNLNFLPPREGND